MLGPFCLRRSFCFPAFLWSHFRGRKMDQKLPRRRCPMTVCGAAVWQSLNFCNVLFSHLLHLASIFDCFVHRCGRSRPQGGRFLRVVFRGRNLAPFLCPRLFAGPKPGPHSGPDFGSGTLLRSRSFFRLWFAFFRRVVSDA